MAGCIAAMSSVTYPAISAFASSHASADQQGNQVLPTFLICQCFYYFFPHVSISFQIYNIFLC